MPKPSAAELNSLCFQMFLTRADVGKLVYELPPPTRKKIQDGVFKWVGDELKKANQRLADDKYLPADFVFQYLGQFGITKAAILRQVNHQKSLVKQPQQ